jgi:hypothetical protein
MKFRILSEANFKGSHDLSRLSGKGTKHTKCFNSIRKLLVPFVSLWQIIVFRLFVFILFVFLTSAPLQAQNNNIVGAACAIQGTVYDYSLTGSIDSNVQIIVCITGGAFINSTQSCQSISARSFVRVSWDSTASINKLTFTYGNTQKTIRVYVTDPLKGGEIANAHKRQIIRYNQAAGIIPCAPASKGACTPVYTYQWQKSSNALNWVNIAGATGQHLPSQGALQEPVFYRRKVTETSTGNIAYSTIATVFVEAQ